MFIRIRGKILGPLGKDELRALRDRGHFRRFHEISEDRITWASAATLEEFFPDRRECIPLAPTPSPASTAPTRYPAPSEVLPSTETESVSRSSDGPDRETGPTPDSQLSDLEDMSVSEAAWQKGLGDAQSGLAVFTELESAAPSAGDTFQPLATLLWQFAGNPIDGLAPLCAQSTFLASAGLGLLFSAMAILLLGIGLWLSALPNGFNAEADQGRANPARFLQTNLRTIVGDIEAKDDAGRAAVVLELIGLAIFPMMALSLTLITLRALTHASGNPGHDVLVSGYLMLLLSVVFSLAVGAGLLNAQLALIPAALACSFGVLVLNSHLTRNLRRSGFVSALLIPSIVFAIASAFKALCERA